MHRLNISGIEGGAPAYSAGHALWYHALLGAVAVFCIYTIKIIQPPVPEFETHLLVCVLLLPWAWWRRRQLSQAAKAAWPLFLLFAVYGIHGIGDWINLTIFTAQCLLGLLVAIECTYNERQQLLLTVFTSIVLLQWLAVIIRPDFAIYPKEIYDGAWRGILFHKNGMGVNVGLACIYFLWRFLLQPKSGTRNFFACMVILSVVMLWQSHSLTAQTATMGAAICLLIFFGRINIRLMQRVGIIGFMLALFMLVAFLALVYWPEHVPAWLIKYDTVTGRIVIWQYVWPYIVDRPWGYGFTFWYQEDAGIAVNRAIDFSFRIYHAHNGLLETLLQSGVPGVLLLVIVVVKTINASLAMLTRGDNRADRVEALWALALFTFIMIEDISESMVLGIRRPLMIWFIIAVVVVLCRYAAVRGAQPGRRAIG